MLQDVFHPPEQLPIDDISSPISDQIFDFCDPDLFSDTLQNSEVTSSSNCCYEDNSSYTTTTTNNYTNNNSTIPPDIDKFNNYQETNNNNNNSNTTTTTTATSTTTTATTATTNTTTATNNLSIIFDSQDEIDNDISASIDFSPSPTFSIPQFLSSQQQYPFDFTSSSPSMQPQHTNPHHPIQIPSSLTDQTVVIDGSILSSLSQFPVDPVPPLLGPPSAATLPSVFDDDCLSSVPAYVAPNLNPSSPSCSFLGPGMGTYLPVTGTITGGFPPDGAGIFSGSILTGSSELQPQELDFQGDNAGIFSCNPDSMQRVFNTGDLQKALSGDSQQLVGAVSSSTPITSEMSSLEDSTFKVGKLSVEQRKEKIHRYMKKRNERNFSKKIKYACRKTLADSRPRVRGRFAKNDDFGEAHRTTSSNHEEDDDEEVVVKEEDELVDSDIFAHISGVNSFKCNYPIQSWI